ncbi:MAG: hypothetical protein ACYC27_11870 [Armatimonadota bacterium]
MGINVVLQDEKCMDISETVFDLNDVVALCLPSPSDNAYCCVRFIDPYGDTIFNRIQAVVILDEWNRLRHSFADHSADVLWSDIRELIIRCTEEPHTYLRFMGD